MSRARTSRLERSVPWTVAAALALAIVGCPAPSAAIRPPPLPLAPAEQHDEPVLAGVVHVVKPGETIYRIARAYGIDAADLMETNGIDDPRALAVGTELFVPGAVHTVDVPPAPVPGDLETPAPGSTPSASPAQTASRSTSTSTSTKLTPTATPSPSPRPLQTAPTSRSTSTSTKLTPTATPSPSPLQTAPTSTSTKLTPTATPSSSGATSQAGGPPTAHPQEPILTWPLKGVLYGRYGVRAGHRHDGIDIAAPEGTPVGAAAPGTVIYAGEQAGYGAIVMVRHDNGLVTIYAHAAQLLVQEGARVRGGEPIATVGQTGRTTGPHLHFEVRDGTRPRNPLLFLP